MKFNKYMYIYIGICLIFILYLIRRDYILGLKYTYVSTETELDTMQIDDSWTDRGTLYLNDTLLLVITSYSKVVSNPQNFKDWNCGPYNHSYTYSIGDLPSPYTLWKKENNDTLYVKKDSFNLKFLLFKPLE